MPKAETRIDVAVAQKHWDNLSDFGCCSYMNPDIALGSNGCAKCCGCCPVYCQQCVWCPNFCPQAVNAPCITMGQITTQLQHEDGLCGNKFCMGRVGCGICLLLMIPVQCVGGLPPAAPLQFSCVAACCTMRQRRRLLETYGLDSAKESLCKAFACYPCALFRHFVFVTEMRKLISGTDNKAQSTVMTAVTAAV